MKIERCTEEQFLTVLDDFGPWNHDSLAMDPNPVDSDEMADAFHLYVEVNPWQHYRVTFCPSRDKWADMLEQCRELARSEDPDTYNSYIK